MAMALKAQVRSAFFALIFAEIFFLGLYISYMHTYVDAPISNGLDFHVSSPGLMIFATLPLSNLENSCPAPPFPSPHPKASIAFLGMFWYTYINNLQTNKPLHPAVSQLAHISQSSPPSPLHTLSHHIQRVLDTN